jgi:tRNA(Ile)-lysidine synthase TilS/MesJ
VISKARWPTPNMQSRVLATCEEHGLDYVIDETNFQPEITLRNAVRDTLAAGDTSDVSVLTRIPFPMLIKSRICVTIKHYRK